MYQISRTASGTAHHRRDHEPVAQHPLVAGTPGGLVARCREEERPHDRVPCHARVEDRGVQVRQQRVPLRNCGLAGGYHFIPPAFPALALVPRALARAYTRGREGDRFFLAVDAQALARACKRGLQGARFGVALWSGGFVIYKLGRLDDAEKNTIDWSPYFLN